MISLLTGKLKAIALGSIGILAVISTALYGLLQREKKKALEQELEDTEASQRVSRRANEAVIRGSANEHIKEDRSNYKFGNHS